MMDLQFPHPVAADESVPCSRTSDVCRVFDADETALDAYVAQLEEAGFSRLMKRTLPSGTFYTYTDGDVKLSVSLLTERKELRVFSEVMRPTPAFSKMGEKKYSAVTLTQFCTNTSRSINTKSASGMGYVLRLTDGRLIVIDGGFHSAPDFDNDYPDLMKLLWELSDGEKPQVAAWIVTHNHLDHYGALMQVQPEDADIHAYISTLPKEGIVESACVHMMSSIPNYAEKNYPVHAGDRIDFGDVVMDVFYTYEEGELYNPDPVRKDGNNQSLIFAFTIGEQKALFVGDAYYHCANLAAELAGEEIRADICQIGHHGRTSHKDDAFYEKVSPKVALWPGCYLHIDLFRLIYKTNQWIFGETSTIVDHYVATDGNQTLTFPYELKGLSYCSDGKYPPENLQA